MIARYLKIKLDPVTHEALERIRIQVPDLSKEHLVCSLLRAGISSLVASTQRSISNGDAETSQAPEGLTSEATSLEENVAGGSDQGTTPISG